MEDVLRWSLLVVGSCVIAGVAVHGIWVSRKNSEQKSKTRTPEQEFQSGTEYIESDCPDEENVPLGRSNVDNLDEPVINFSLDDENKPADGEEKSSFDELGIGTVRVVSLPSNKQAIKEPQAILKSNDAAIDSQENNRVTENADLPVVGEIAEAPSSSKIYASVVTQPKPEYAEKYQSTASVGTQSIANAQQQKDTSTSASVAKTSKSLAEMQTSAKMVADGYQAPEPPPFLLKQEQQPKPVDSSELPTSKNVAPASKKQGTEKNPASLAEKPTLAEQAKSLVKRKKSESNRKRREPKIAEDQLHINFDDEPEPNQPITEQSPSESESPTNAKPQAQEQPQEVLVLNVKAVEGETIPGSALLPMLLTLGFKFGDQDIFHRHVNSNGKGPVLFSLANMFKPGVFDIDNLENFTTQGISLFMILPIEGDPHQVFNMMHNAARKISDEFSAQIFDAKRALLTKQSLQQYVEKIREFERQRILRG